MRCTICGQNSIHLVGGDCQNINCAENWNHKKEREEELRNLDERDVEKRQRDREKREKRQ